MLETNRLGKRPRGRPRRQPPLVTIQDLRSLGLSFREIARTLGFGYGTVRRAYAAMDRPSPPEAPVPLAAPALVQDPGAFESMTYTEENRPECASAPLL